MLSLISLLERSLQRKIRITKVELIAIEHGDRWIYTFSSYEDRDAIQGRVVIEWRGKPVVQHIDFT